MKNRKKRPAHAQRRIAVLSFAVFILIALALVTLLEFLDYRAGNYSLIFTRLFPLRQPLTAGQQFEREWRETLVRRKVAHDSFKDRDGVTHFKVDVADPGYFPLAKSLHGLVEKYRGLSQLSEVQGMKGQTVYLYQIRFDRRLSQIILLTRKLAGTYQATPTEATAPAKKKIVKTPRLAFVIDDVGYSDGMAEQLRVLGIPLTAAIIPSAPFARSEAGKIHALGLEEIIHLPMQPRDPANHHPRGEFVLLDSSDSEIAALIANARAVVPHARGLNNHMGSLVTSDPRVMRRVLDVVKEAGLFFVDSKTAPETVAYRLAREMKIKTAIRDVFLDDVADYDHSLNQIKTLLELARQNGQALAIGHPFASTLAALRDAVPWLKQQRVEIVFASALLE
jgi:polysaccharide deacetylase 2 family uncharacterized protein YibQ